MKIYKFKNLKIGTSKSFKTKINKNIIKKFISLSGDLNKLHVHDGFARKYNFKKKVVHGMLLGSLYSKFIGMYLPGKYSLLVSMDINFNKPIYLNDTITIKGRVIDKSKIYKIATVKITSTNQLKKIVSNAKVVVKLNE